MNKEIKILGSNNHKLILGDVLIALNDEVRDNSIDLIFIDPPYNIGKNFNGHKDKWEKDSDYLE